MLHSIYQHGGLIRWGKGASSAARSEVKASVGAEVEGLVAGYAALKWNRTTIPAIATDVPSYDAFGRGVVLIRLANEVDENLDGGVLYLAEAERRRNAGRPIVPFLVMMAQQLGYANLADELSRVFDDTWTAALPDSKPQTLRRVSVLVPRSCRKRLGSRLAHPHRETDTRSELKVVVTGGLGVLAHWFVRELLVREGGRGPYDVAVFDRRRGHIPGVRTIVGDHEDYEAVASAVAGADAVLHLSASHLTPGTNPVDVFRSNLLGLFNVHEAARIHGVKRVVHWSSVAALGWSGGNDAFMPDYLPIDEDHPLRATNAYGLSKVTGEHIASAFAERYGMETIALRHVWTIGLSGWIRLWKDGGKHHGKWIHYAYLDVRDAAVAARRGLEVPAPGHTVLYLAADDSCAPAPLSELLPGLRPAVADMASPSRTDPIRNLKRPRQNVPWVATDP